MYSCVRVACLTDGWFQDAVNLAARLEGLGKFYKQYVVLSEATWHEPGVREAFCARCLDAVAVVGKRDTTLIFSILARRMEATANDLLIETWSRDMIMAYRAGSLDACWRALDKLDCLLPDDYTLSLMRERVKIMRDAGGVPPNWTGVVSMTSK